MKLAVSLALAGGTALAAQLIALPAFAGWTTPEPPPMLHSIAADAAATSPARPATTTAAPSAAAPAPAPQPAAHTTVRRGVDVRADLARARADLARDQRIPAERWLDVAATYLLNQQQAARAGQTSATPYDMAVRDVIAAFHAARQGDMATARTMVDGAIQALPASI